MISAKTFKQKTAYEEKIWMSRYNLNALGDNNFEHLCQSLIQKIIGPGAKIYGMGKDGAREATFNGTAPYPSLVEKWGGAWIFQVKFHDIQQIGPKEARRRLLEDLDNELNKVVNKYGYECNNYILMTNVSLTPAFQTGLKDKIDNTIVTKYRSNIKNIQVLGAEEICGFLDDNKDVRMSYASLLVPNDIVANLLGIIEKKQGNLEELIKLYCQGCFTHERSAPLDDAGDMDEKGIDLHDIFIDLNVKPRPYDELRSTEEAPQWLKQACDDEGRNSALSYLYDDTVRELVLVGGPGEGKSTLGQYVAQIHRAKIIGKAIKRDINIQEFQKCVPRIPFRILLREYAQWIALGKNKSDSLFHYLSEHISRESGKNTCPEEIHQLLKDNQVLLILDGLDEVQDKVLRTKVLDSITIFVNQARNVHACDLRIIATTRPHGYSDEYSPNHFIHLEIQPLTEKMANSYAQLWAGARERNIKENERILNTFETCLSDKVVNVLAKTPLQVTILLVIIRARGSPPKQREELFNQYMDIIYLREQKKSTELLRTEQNTIYALHKYLAYILHKRAEKNKTAALMDLSEFEEKVRAYIGYNSNVLNTKELENQVNQIINEVSQRLVLIQSPQQGKVGFELTTIREFFAAAHLVDTAKDTKEKCLRFRAIAQAPYWRNVALFFAGRVGRLNSGEAPNLIDVCRDIDTKEPDTFLRRGAKLVMEMVDDRVLREQYNEVGAIQYGLESLYGETSSIDTKPDRFFDNLRNLSGAYKERVVFQWMEDELLKVEPENLMEIANVYQNLFGNTTLFLETIKKASECKHNNVRLWAISKALEIAHVEPWVMTCLEKIIQEVPLSFLEEEISQHYPNFTYYAKQTLSPQIRLVLASSILLNIQLVHKRELPSKCLSSELEHQHNETALYLSVVYKLLEIYNLFAQTARMRFSSDNPVSYSLPGIIYPKVKKAIAESEGLFLKFYQAFENEKHPLTKLLNNLFLFLLEPQNVEKYKALISQYKLTCRPRKGLFDYSHLSRLLSLFLGRFPLIDSQIVQYHKSLHHFYASSFSDNDLIAVESEINEILNKNSVRIKNHQIKLLQWLTFGQSKFIEEYLDARILAELQEWIKRKSLSIDTPCLLNWAAMIHHEKPLDLLHFTINIWEKQLETEAEPMFNSQLMFLSYKLNKDNKEELVLSERFSKVLDMVMTKRTHDWTLNLGNLFWFYLDLGLLKEKEMTFFYNAFREECTFDYFEWERNSTVNLLLSFLQSENIAVTRLAAASLQGHDFDEKLIENKKVCDKLWELIENKNDYWQIHYLRCLSKCKVNWFEKRSVWLKTIKEAKSEELRQACCDVFQSAGYLRKRDRQAFFNILVETLKAKDIALNIRLAARTRLSSIAHEVESRGFDEELLNLPLKRRD